MKYIFDEQKNIKLKKERGICFDDVIIAVNNGKILDIIPHHNKKEYPNQMILIIEINDLFSSILGRRRFANFKDGIP